MKNETVVLIILGVIIVGAFIGMQSKKESIEIECSSDSECIKVRTTCCPCSMGGEEICVSSSEEQSYKEKLEEECTNENIACVALYNCKIESCGCVEGRCVGTE